MQILLEGKTQEEVEMMFSKASLLETIAVEADLFINEMEEDHFKLLQDLFTPRYILLCDLYIIGIVANPMVYSLLNDGYRCIQTSGVIKALAFSRFMVNNYPDKDEAFRLSFDIIKAMDGVLYDIDYVNIKFEDGEYRKIAHCLVGFELDSSLAVAPELEFFKIPMIETPNDWTTRSSGGYHLNESKPTLNRGESEQPQEVLDILNTLQHNAYTLTDDAHLEPLQDYIVDKLMKKYDVHYAESIERNITKSADIVFNTMRNRTFYFEWKLDFRGRLYSTGYDINLQGDKFRKGIITPVIPGRVTIC